MRLIELQRKELDYMMTSKSAMIECVSCDTSASSDFQLLSDCRFSDDMGSRKPILPQYDNEIEDEVIILLFWQICCISFLHDLFFMLSFYCLFLFRE